MGFVFCLLAVLWATPRAQTINGLSAIHSLPAGPTLSDERTIHKLEVRIDTRDNRGGGTDNAVYFDIGPLAWRLDKARHNDFERGRSDTYELKKPEGVVLRTGDILWLRLQKKGVIGVTGTGDGLDGAWHPESITLIVNGVSWPSVPVDGPLNSRYWFWRKLYDVNPYANPVSFVRSLRFVPNQKLTSFSRFIGFATTPLFKKAGISGWLECPQAKEFSQSLMGNACPKIPHTVCATGIVTRKPASSTDGLATIDLRVEAVEFCDENGTCSGESLAKLDTRPRYLRVEYKHGKGVVPKDGEHIRICGKLLWDTDKEGWWEIHPRNRGDVTWPPRNSVVPNIPGSKR